MILRRYTDLEMWRNAPPRWYGLAWREMDRAVGVFAPIPLNHLMAGARWLYWALRCSVVPSPIDRAFDRGYELGRRHEREHTERLREAEDRAFERLVREVTAARRQEPR